MKLQDDNNTFTKSEDAVSATYLLLNNQTVEEEIDLYSLLQVLLQHIWVIVASIILFGAVFGAVTYYCITPKYSATAKLYIVSTSGDSLVDLTDLDIGTSLTSDYEELLKCDPVVETVITYMNLSYTKEELLGMVTVSNPDDTRILNITATSTDPKEAMNIANTFVRVAIEYLPQTMSTSAPNIAQRAILPEQKISPSITKNALFGAIFGMLLSCGFYLIRFLMDDTFHTADDIENYYGIVPLTVVPKMTAQSRK